jgi:hypothetical protein
VRQEAARGVLTLSLPVPVPLGAPGLLFVLLAESCAIFDLRLDRTAATAGRTIRVGGHEDRNAAARAAQDDPDIRASQGPRQRWNAIAHIQHFGIRKAGDRSRRKTRLHALPAASVANFGRVAVLARSTPRRSWPLPPEHANLSRPIVGTCQPVGERL